MANTITSVYKSQIKDVLNFFSCCLGPLPGVHVQCMCSSPTSIEMKTKKVALDAQVRKSPVQWWLEVHTAARLWCLRGNIGQNNC